MADDDSIELLIADLYEAAGLLRQAGETIAAVEGQTQARWQLLSVVSGHAQTVPHAARRLGVSRQAVQRVANDLVDAALLQSVTNPDHRTSPLLALTGAGRTTLDRINAGALRINEPLGETIGTPAIAATRQTLHTLIDELKHQADKTAD